jgi:DNA-binding NarL/FixJ family response regulator
MSGAHSLTDPLFQAGGVTEPNVRVLFADVPGAGRRAIATLLRSLPGIALVAEAGTLDELARERRRTAPDVMIVDDRLLAELGLDPRDGDLPLIVVGLDDDPSFARRAHRLGAAAWIAKEHAGELLPEALDDAGRQRGGSASRPAL